MCHESTHARAHAHAACSRYDVDIEEYKGRRRGGGMGGGMGGGTGSGTGGGVARGPARTAKAAARAPALRRPAAPPRVAAAMAAVALRALGVSRSRTSHPRSTRRTGIPEGPGATDCAAPLPDWGMGGVCMSPGGVCRDGPCIHPCYVQCNVATHDEYTANSFYERHLHQCFVTIAEWLK